MKRKRSRTKGRKRCPRCREGVPPNKLSGDNDWGTVCVYCKSVIENNCKYSYPEVQPKLPTIESEGRPCSSLPGCVVPATLQVAAPPFYSLDPGNHAGIRLPNGKFITNGISERGKKTKQFPMDQVLSVFLRMPRHPICSDAAYLASDKGLTVEFIKALIRNGFPFFLRHTRKAGWGRAGKCAAEKPHKDKQDGCAKCTERDLVALTGNFLEHLKSPNKGLFYRPRFNRMNGGSPKASGSLSANIKTELNRLRFEKPPYSSLNPPEWLLKMLGSDIVAVATIIVTARHVFEARRGLDYFFRELSTNSNQKRGIGHSNFARFYSGDKKLYRQAAKAYFRWLKSCVAPPEELSWRLAA